MEDLYYIQNTGRPVGNCARWWCPLGNGYTADLDKAWRVTKEQAEEICRSRPGEDIPRRVDAVDVLAQRHLDTQHLSSLDWDRRQREERLKSAAPPRAPRSEIG